MTRLRTRLALWIAPWLKQSLTIRFPPVYSGTTCNSTVVREWNAPDYGAS